MQYRKFPLWEADGNFMQSVAVTWYSFGLLRLICNNSSYWNVNTGSNIENNFLFLLGKLQQFKPQFDGYLYIELPLAFS
jgi:hypothetical protein